MNKKNRKKLLCLCILCVIVSVLVTMSVGATEKLNKKSITMNAGKTYQLKVTGSKVKVTWSSNKPSVATVDQTGKVKAVRKGTCKITAKVGKKRLTCKVTVKQPVIKIVLNKSALTLDKGKKFTLKAKVLPGSANKKGLKWTSNNKKVAIVSSKGVVKGLKDGTARITAVAKDGSGVKATCIVEVESQETKLKKYVQGFWEGIPLVYCLHSRGINGISPCMSLSYPLTWGVPYATSSNPSVLKIVNDGDLIPLKAGTAIVTAYPDRTRNKKYGASRKIRVIDMNAYYKTVKITKENFFDYFEVKSFMLLKNVFSEIVDNGIRYEIRYKDTNQWYIYSLDNFAVELGYTLHYYYRDIDYSEESNIVETISGFEQGAAYINSSVSANEELALKNMTVRRCKGDLILINKAAIDKNHPIQRGEKTYSYLEYNTIDGMTVIAHYGTSIK